MERTFEAFIVGSRDAAAVRRSSQNIHPVRTGDREIKCSGAAAVPNRQEYVSGAAPLLRGVLDVGEEQMWWLELRAQARPIAQIREMVPEDIVPPGPVAPAWAAQGV